MEMYYSDYCPKCNKKNFFCVGDVFDTTGRDIDGGKCYQCGHEWLFDENGESTDIENANIEEGQKELK